MQKIDLLQPAIENILLNIDFVEKYKEIWEKYNVEDDDYTISPSEVINTFGQLGYLVSKSNSEQYFSDFFECNSFFIESELISNIVLFILMLVLEMRNLISKVGEAMVCLFN